MRFRQPSRFRPVHMWSDALDDLNDLAQRDDLTVDQRFKLAEIKALLSISQELSNIHRDGIAVGST